MTKSKHIAIVGAGIAGISCARTLVQAGHRVTVFEKSRGVGGRMSTRNSPFGTFDHGAQYFTVRDPRFAQAIETAPGVCRPWSATTVRVLDARGMVAAAALEHRESHWVAKPGMNALAKAWAAPIAEHIHLDTRVDRVERDTLNKHQWQLRTEGGSASVAVHGAFDAVVLAIPHPQAQALLQAMPHGGTFAKAINKVTVLPCWTLMLAFPQAVQPGLTTLGPHWNAARSTHHRIAWSAGRCRLVPTGRPNTSRTAPSACRPSCCAPLPRSPVSAPNQRMWTPTAGSTPKRTKPWGAATCGRPNMAWAFAVIGA